MNKTDETIQKFVNSYDSCIETKQDEIVFKFLEKCEEKGINLADRIEFLNSVKSQEEFYSNIERN